MESTKRVKISTRALLFSFALRTTGMKSRFKRMVQNPARTKKGFVPESLYKSYKTDSRIVDSKTVVTIEKKDKVTDTHIIYLHGGSWIFEASPLHWKLIRKIIDRSYCRISVLDYPLAPEHNYKETLKMVMKTYSLLLEEYPDDHLILMGDSAGGNIALAFVQKLIRENISNLPVKNVLLCPCVDISFSNPEIQEIVHLDHILSVELVQHGAIQYSDGDDQDQYLLSPINGDLEKIPETAVFYSTHEILMPDILRLKAKAENTGARFKFCEYEGMQHDWMLFPIPESQKVIEEVCDFIAAN